MRGKMDCFGLTDAGKVRPVNEDQFLMADSNKSMLIHQTSLSHDDHTRLFGGSQGKLLLVADGMGGHAEGKRASTIAVQTVANYILNTMPWFFRLEEGDDGDLKDELRESLEEGQKSIEAAAQAEAGRRKMGTTLTMAYLLWPRLYVVHAGDSRCYLLRNGRLQQITKDHTIAQQMVERGALTPEEAEQSRWSHVLWNCIGGGTHDLNPDVYRATLQVGDTLLLCTDGLNKCVKDDEIRDALGKKGSAEQTCNRLVNMANDLGGPDNVTVLVAHFRDASQPLEQAEAEIAASPEADLATTLPYTQPLETPQTVPAAAT
jgi:PPM family protein phosphatase